MKKLKIPTKTHFEDQIWTFSELNLRQRIAVLEDILYLWKSKCYPYDKELLIIGYLPSNLDIDVTFEEIILIILERQSYFWDIEL